MKFTCDSCNAQYMISDEKVGPSGVKVRCKKCGHVILVRHPEPEPAAEPAAGALFAEWWVAIDEQPVGPVALELVQHHWDLGEIGPESLVWYAGLTEWTAVEAVPELHAHLLGHGPAAGAPLPGGSAGPDLEAPAPREERAPAPPPQEEWRPGAGQALAALEEPVPRPAAPAPDDVDSILAPPAEPPVQEPAPVEPTAGAGADPTGVRPLPIQGLERTGERRLPDAPGHRGARVRTSRSSPAPRSGGRSLTVVLLVALAVVAAAAAGLWWLTK
jgi:predicted Zn finger-like uncharacterized protein